MQGSEQFCSMHAHLKYVMAAVQGKLSVQDCTADPKGFQEQSKLVVFSENVDQEQHNPLHQAYSFRSNITCKSLSSLHKKN